MAKLSEKKAIQECKKLWSEIEASGESKFTFLGSDNGRKWVHKGHQADCPLCQYATDREKGKCTHCPLLVQYSKTCGELGFQGYNSDVTEFTKYVNNLKEKK